MCSAYVRLRSVQGQGKKLTLFPMLHMEYSSPSVIALVMIAFVSESTRLVLNLETCMRKKLKSLEILNT